MHRYLRVCLLAVLTTVAADIPAGQAQTPDGEDAGRNHEVRVLLAWLADAQLCRYHPHVRAEGDCLHLSGVVPSEALRVKAERIARGQGRFSIQNQIRVCPALVVQPAKSPAKVLVASAKLALDTEFARDCKHCKLTSDDDGRLALGGLVGNLETKLRVSERLRRIPGCMCVDNRLQVSGSLALADLPSVDNIIKNEQPKAPPPLTRPSPPRQEGRVRGQRVEEKPAVPGKLAVPQLPVSPSQSEYPKGEFQPRLPELKLPPPVPAARATPKNALPKTTRPRIKPQPQTFVSSPADSASPTTSGRKPDDGLRWQPSGAVQRVAAQYSSAANQSSASQWTAYPRATPRRFPFSQLQALKKSPTVGAAAANYSTTPPSQVGMTTPAANTTTALTDAQRKERRLYSVIQNAFGGSLAGLQVRLTPPKALQVRFACRSEGEAYQIAGRIMKLPQLADYAVKLSASVPRRQANPAK